MSRKVAAPRQPPAFCSIANSEPAAVLQVRLYSMACGSALPFTGAANWLEREPATERNPVRPRDSAGQKAVDVGWRNDIIKV